MFRSHRISTLILLALAFTVLTGFGHDQAFWSQWGRTAQHQGMVNVAAQPLNRKLADIVYDPFAMQEEAEIKVIGGEYALTAHYQATLIDGNSFYMVLKSGTYDLCQPLAEWYKGGNCGPNAWGQLIWNVVRYDWQQENVAPAWTFTTELLSFPNGRHDDQVDSVSQFLRWWQNEAYQHPLPCTPILVMRADMGLPRRTSTGHAGTECSIQIGTFVVASGRLASYDGWTDQPQSIDAIGPPVRRSGQARHRHAEGGPPVGIDPNPDFSYP